MDYSYMYELRRSVLFMFLLCSAIDKSEVRRDSINVPLEEILRLECIDYCIFLLASHDEYTDEIIDVKIDEKIDERIDFLKILFAIESDEEIWGYIDERISNLKKISKDNIPIFFNIIKEVEDLLSPIEKHKLFSDKLLEFLYAVGFCFIYGSKNPLDDDFEFDCDKDFYLEEYMETICDYFDININDIIHKNDEYYKTYITINDNSDSFIRNKPLFNLNFSTAKIKSSGNTELSCTLISKIMLATVKIKSQRSKFTAFYYDGEGNKSDAIVDVVGDFEGTVLFDNSDAKGKFGKLVAKADGAWSINFIPISKAVAMNGSSNIRGKGCLVSDSFVGEGKMKNIKCKHDGNERFSIKLVSATGFIETILDTFGKFNGEIYYQLEKGLRYFVAVEADGNWSVDFGLGDNIHICQIKEYDYYEND